MLETSDAVTQVIGRRYTLRDQLGKGGMGSVYRAVDRLTGQTIALKRVTTEEFLTPREERNQQKFRLALAREFKALATLRHPHVIGVLDYGFDTSNSDAPEPYFTMELLEAPLTFAEATRGQPLDLQIDLLLQMLQALSYVHRRGVIHRDLKPTNALVVNGEVKVLDFGVAVTEGIAQENEISGTLMYMSPEVLQSEGSFPASDLYAVGIMAYEMLTGGYPFEAPDSTSLIVQILTAEPNFSQLDISLEIINVLKRLLEKTPEKRYQRADDVIADLSAALGREIPPEDDAIRESYLQAAKFVGRDTQLAQLSEAFIRATDNQGSAWLIAGESGVGKSRLLDELRTLALVEGALVLRGQEVSEPGTPFQLWANVLRWLALVTELNDLELSQLSLILPDLPTMLGKRGEDLDIAEHGLDPQAAQEQLITIIEDLFRRQQQPIMVILEDLHWTGSEGLLLFDRLSGIVQSLPVLFVASYRDDERPELPDLLPSTQTLKLPRLNEKHIAELSEAMLGNTAHQRKVVDFLFQETEGNVFFVVEVVRALAQEAGRLGKVAQMNLPEGVFAGGMNQLLQRRLSRIPERDHQLLQIAAVIGRQVDLALLPILAASQRAPLQLVELDTWLTVCANFAVLEFTDGAWRFAHDKLREGLLHDLTDEERYHLHRQVAAAIEERYSGMAHKTTALAYHWSKAGDTGREAHYAALAGKQALNTTAYRDAVVYLERAIELHNKPVPIPQSDSDDRRDTKEMLDARSQQRIAYLIHELGEAYFGFGECTHAKELYERSLTIFETIKDRLGIARVYGSLGEVCYALGDYPEAQRLYREGLRLSEAVGDRLGAAHIRRDLGKVASTLGDYREARHLYQQSLMICKEIGDRMGMAHALTNLGAIANDSGNYAEARKLSTDSAAIFRDIGDRRGLAMSLNNLGSIAEALGEYDEAKQHYTQCHTIFTEIGDRSGIALALNRLGKVSAIQKGYAEAIEFYQHAGTLFEKIGEAWGVAQSLIGLGTVSRLLDNYADAISLFKESLSISHDIGDRRGMTTAFNLLGDIARLQNNSDDAWAHYRQALKLAMDIRAVPLALDVLDGVAAQFIKEGKLERALDLLLLTLNHPALDKLGHNESESLMALLESELSPDTIATARAKGQGQTLENIVRDLLNGVEATK